MQSSSSPHLISQQGGGYPNGPSQSMPGSNSSSNNPMPPNGPMGPNYNGGGCTPVCGILPIFCLQLLARIQSVQSC